MKSIDVWKALSNKSRVAILRELYRKPHSMKQLSGILDLGTSTIRQHLAQLERADLITSFEVKSPRVGRPALYYRATKDAPITVYPKRMYLPLLRSLLGKMVQQAGEDKTKESLREIGSTMAEEMIRSIEAEQNIRQWSLQLFKEVVVENYFAEMGVEPEVVSVTENSITFQENNCVVLELALQHPDLICDALDEGVHEGLCHAMNPSWNIKKDLCVGHGDETCRFTVTTEREAEA